MYLARDDDGRIAFGDTRDAVVEAVVGFTRALRATGARVPANAGIAAAQALAAVGFDDQAQVERALRAALLSRPEDEDAFERLFPEFWRRLTEGPGAALYSREKEGQAPDGPVPPSENTPTPAAGDGPRAPGARLDALGATVSDGDDVELAGDGEAETAAASYSPTGGSEGVSVPGVGSADDRLDRAFGQLTAVLAAQRGRRWEPAGGERIDTRRALRRSFATGGTVLSVPERSRKQTAVRAVVLVDVSRSVLDTIDREFLLGFLFRARTRWRSARLFFFDTEIREVSSAFDAPTPAAAVDALERAEAEWGGGTRIGDAVETVRRDHPDAFDRDTAVLVVSDGLETGNVDRLETGMAWLARRAGTVLWLNPLAASTEYEPTCRGMAAALPFVDGLFAFSGPDDVAEVARQLGRGGGPVGYEFDPRRRSRG